MNNSMDNKDKADKKDPHSAERQLFQLQKKGFEDVNKSLANLEAPDISGLQKTLEEIRDKEVPEFPASVEAVTVKNQIDLRALEEGVSSVVKAIEDKKFDSTDTAPIEALLKDILEKKDAEIDLAPVLTALKELTDFLKNTPQTKGIDFTPHFKELSRVIIEARPGSAGFNPGSVGVSNVAGVAVNPATEETLAKKFAAKITTSGTTITYVAQAAIGSSQASAVWRAKKITVSGNDTTITWAGGGNFNQVATDLTVLTYS